MRKPRHLATGWQGRVTVDGKDRSIGMFPTQKAAVAAQIREQNKLDAWTFDDRSRGAITADSDLTTARSRFDEAAAAARAIDDATDRVSELDLFWSEVGEVTLDALMDIGNALASMGQTILNHPGDLILEAGGMGLIILGAAGEVGGGALDLSVIGAALGVSVGAVSTAAIVSGVATYGAGVTAMTKDAAGDSRVEPFKKEPKQGRDSGGHYTSEKGNNSFDKERETRALDREEKFIGKKIERRDVKATVPGAKSYRFYDGLVKKEDGTYEGLEVKSGTGKPTPNQKDFDPHVSYENPATARLDGVEIKITSTREIAGESY